MKRLNKIRVQQTIKILSSFLVLIFFLCSCQTVIHPTLDKAPSVLVVSGWLNNKPEKQIVQLTMTESYFADRLPPGVSGATVTVTDNLNNIFYFTDDGTNTGTYQWTPAPGNNLGTVGKKYSLSVTTGGETYTATSEMKRVPPVDSISFSISKSLRFPSGSYIAEFWSTDPKGAGDTYWIRTYKNGILLNKPSEINLAYDAGFSAGGDFDGVRFITPIRQAINPVDKDSNGKILSPYVVGDSVYVEIQSITLAAFDHVTQVKNQTNVQGGFAALFAKPMENVSSNITNTNPNGSTVVGFFNVSAVKGAGRRIRIK